ncbi:MAG: type II toxin-antitoxin system HicB family antitoxin [Candidatus Amesbacteria bacterium]|nr:type II toxin-antitoxin system HicB family antitoxin [Candidatus Amesbacteria bacterium]
MKSAKILKHGLHALVWKEGKYFVAKCVEVEVASQGKSNKEALQNLEEAVELFFADEKIKVPSFSNLQFFPLTYAQAI